MFNQFVALADGDGPLRANIEAACAPVAKAAIPENFAKGYRIDKRSICFRKRRLHTNQPVFTFHVENPILSAPEIRPR